MAKVPPGATTMNHDDVREKREPTTAMPSPTKASVEVFTRWNIVSVMSLS